MFSTWATLTSIPSSTMTRASSVEHLVHDLQFTGGPGEADPTQTATDYQWERAALQLLDGAHEETTTPHHITTHAHSHTLTQSAHPPPTQERQLSNSQLQSIRHGGQQIMVISTGDPERINTEHSRRAPELRSDMGKQAASTISVHRHVAYVGDRLDNIPHNQKTADERSHSMHTDITKLYGKVFNNPQPPSARAVGHPPTKSSQR